VTISHEEFQQAAQRMKPVLRPTPLMYSDFLSEEYGAQVWIKPENLQRTGAFKIRGAFNKIASLSPEERKRGIVTASAGNHAQGVALAAQVFSNQDDSTKIVATIVMPETTPLIKVDATRKLGARVVLFGDNYDEAYGEAMRIAEQEGAVFVHPFNDKAVICGQGTIGLEILEELPDADIVFVPTGGGGLLAGIATAIKHINPHCKVIGVEPEGAACITRSYTAGELVELEEVDTIADGVAVKLPGDISFAIIQEDVAGMLTVPDSEIMEALLILMERSKIVAENAGALSVAALKHYGVKGKKVVCLVSGGNIDVITISEMLTRGLVSRGRLFSFAVELRHKPGELVKISQLLAELKANVIELDHNQFLNPARFKSVRLEITVETNGTHHVEQIIEAIKKAGYVMEVLG